MSCGDGLYHCCAIRADDDTLACWGLSGGLGESEVPPSGRFSSVDVGYSHQCALRADGQVLCWGNFSGGMPGPEYL